MPDEHAPADSGVQAQILVQLAVIGTKLDTAIASQADHEGRLRKVESRLNQALGWGIGMGTGSGVAAGVLTHVVASGIHH